MEVGKNPEITPRKEPGYRFFDRNPGVCDVVREQGLDLLDPEDRHIAGLFIGALCGKKRVIDAGCGSGFPGLYLAPGVGELIGVDASPNSIQRAKAHASHMNINNAEFRFADALNLGFRDASFDAAMACGLLGSMDWEEARKALSELYRVLEKKAMAVVLDQDWSKGEEFYPEAWLSFKEGELMLEIVDEIPHPPTEIDSRYLIDPQSDLGAELIQALGGQSRVMLDIRPDEIEPDAVLDAWFDRTAKLDKATLQGLMKEAGFGKIDTREIEVWGHSVFLTCLKA